MNLRIYAAAAALLLLGCSHDGQPGSQAPVSTLNYYAPGPGKALPQVVAQELARHKTPVLYFYADWCGPCRRFRETLNDEQVQAALASATLIKINVDEDVQGLADKYGVPAVPTFVKLDANLRPLAQISSDAWGEDEPGNIAPVMQQFVAR